MHSCYQVLKAPCKHFTNIMKGGRSDDMFLDKPVKGIRKLRHSSLKPGSSMEKTSMESLLSQLQGAPSPQIPTPINFCCNVVSTDSTCCLVRGSMPVFSYSLSKLPILTNFARIAKGNKTAICYSSSCPVLIFFTLTQQWYKGGH